MAKAVDSGWPPRGHRRRRSSRSFTNMITALAFVILAVLCMAGGWYFMNNVINKRESVAKNKDTQADKLPPPPTRPSATNKDTQVAVVIPKDTKDTKPIETKDTKPAEPKDAKPAEPKDAKPAEPKDAKPAEPKDAKPAEPKDAKPAEPKDAKKDTPAGAPTVELLTATFDKEIKPIFLVKCGDCHNAKKKEGLFDGSTVLAMLKKGESGEPGLVPGSLDKSHLWVRIVNKDKEFTPMPPKNKLQLTQEEKDKIANWIKTGNTTLTAAPAPAPTPAGTTLAFEKDILPIFNRKCINCHDAGNMKGGLDVTSLKNLKDGGNSGSPAVVPNEPEKSHLWTLVSANSMPPNANKLNDMEKDLIRRWIMMGAKDNKAAMIVAAGTK